MTAMNIQSLEETLPDLLRLISCWSGYRNCLPSNIKIKEWWLPVIMDNRDRSTGKNIIFWPWNYARIA